MSGLLNESLYDEVIHHRQDDAFVIGGNQSYASAERLSVDKHMEANPNLSKKKRSCLHHLLLPIAVIVLAVIVLALSIFTVVAYLEIKSQLNQLQVLSGSFPMDLSMFIENIKIELNNSELTRKNYMMLETKIEQLENDTHELIRTVAKPLTALTCGGIRASFPSSRTGYYYLNPMNDPEYCDMTLSCGGVTGGWMRVAELDMRDTTAMCPNSLTLNTDPFRTCRININSIPRCISQVYTLNATRYSQVCGKIIAYQFGAPDAFHDATTIDSLYVDGISLTHGSPRRHIWTFAGAANEDGSDPLAICPCINTTLSDRAIPPAFVENNYFCDTAAETGSAKVFYADDPLWDGAGCKSQNTCCSFNNPPWFYRQLPQSTTDDIEMRVCRDETSFQEDISIEMLAIYVQ